MHVHTHTQIHPEIAAAVAVVSARGKCSQFNIRNNIEYGLQGIFQQCFCTALCVLSLNSPLNISLIDGHPMSSHIYPMHTARWLMASFQLHYLLKVVAAAALKLINYGTYINCFQRFDLCNIYLEITPNIIGILLKAA